MLLTEQDARRVTDTVLGFVKADDAAVSVASRIHSHLRFSANTFQTSGRRENATAAVTLWIDRKRGSATTNDLSRASLQLAAEQAERLARLAPVDREYLPTIGRQTYRPSEGYAEATANISLDDRARAINDAVSASEKANVVCAGFHQAEALAAATATKNGNFRYERRTSLSLAMTARTKDGGGSGYFLRTHFDVSRLDTGRIAREAIRRALESHGARSLEPGVYSVILEPQAVADLIAGGAINVDARAADEGRSPFSAPGGRTRVGERVFDERINIVSDPWRADLPGSPATAAGLPAQVMYLVRNGALETLSYSRFWAQEKGRQPTPGPINRIMESSTPPTTVDEMIRTAPRALLVSRFWYIRQVDPRTATYTGLTRDGVWLVENGRVQYPVRNFRFNQSVIQMLAPGNVELISAPERVGRSEDQGDNAALVPALRLKAFNFTSQSDAV